MIKDGAQNVYLYTKKQKRGLYSSSPAPYPEVPKNLIKRYKPKKK